VCYVNGVGGWGKGKRRSGNMKWQTEKERWQDAKNGETWVTHYREQQVCMGTGCIEKMWNPRDVKGEGGRPKLLNDHDYLRGRGRWGRDRE